MTETDIEVPRDQWRQRCETFGREHHGWLVNVRRVETGRLEQDRAAALAAGELLAENRPLRQVACDEQGGEMQMTVTVGEAGETGDFAVPDVVRLIRERENGAHLGLRIDARDGTSTLVEFRAPAVPEALDGLAETEL